jgi:hypothetical protein
VYINGVNGEVVCAVFFLAAPTGDDLLTTMLYQLMRLYSAAIVVVHI